MFSVQSYKFKILGSGLKASSALINGVGGFSTQNIEL